MVLRLNGLEVSCVIGDLAWERTREQTLSIDLTLEVDGAAADSDRLSDTVDYVALSASIREALQSARCRMIERAAKIACACALADERVRSAEAAVMKRTPVPGLASATAICRIDRKDANLIQ